MSQTSRTRRAAWCLALVSVFMAACDDKGPSGPTVDPAITLLLGATTVSVTQAGTASVPVTITRVGDFSGAVTVTAEGLPAGVTAAPLTIASGQTQGSLALSADAAAAPTTAGSATIRASGTGVTAQTANLGVTVAVRGTFTVTAGTAAAFAQGASIDVPITINRTGGFIGTVALSANAPAGLTVAFTPASVSGTASTSSLRLTAAASLAPGTYPVVVTAQTPGLAAQNVTVNAVVTVAGNYSMALTPGTLSLAQGGAGSAALAINRTGGFAGAVALTATAPTGITATVTPASATGNTATVNITVGAAAPVGPHTVVIRGVTPGLTDQTVSLSVNVAAPGSFALSLTPGTLSLGQGATGQATVNIARAGGFTGAVTLSASAPAGLTATLDPSAVTGNSSALSVAAGAALAPGTYTVTVTGTAAGVANQTAQLAVTVTAPGTMSIAVVPAALTLAPGASGTSTVTITRGGSFTGAVNLSATAPAGITVAFDAATVAGNTAVATVTAGAGVAAGSYEVVVRATGAGVPDQTATIAVTVAAPGGFSLALTPATLALQPGTSGTANLAITRTGGFAGAVNLTATAPAGITVTFDPAAPTGNASAVGIAVAGGTAPGTYNVTINATGTGVPAQSVTLAVQVSTAGGFTVALAPQSLALTQGTNGTVNVNLTRTGGYSDAVALTATAPAGVTVTFTPASVTGTTAAMNVAVAANVAAGPYTVTVRANGPNVAEQTATLALQVNPSQVGGGNVTWTFCGLSGLPNFVAAQDGDGAWTRVTGNGNAYSFQISSGRGGIAYVVPADGGGWDTEVFYGTTAELQAQGQGLCFGSTGAKTVNGSIAPAPGPLEIVFVTLGNAMTQVLGSSGASAFTLTDVLDGPVDLVATRLALNMTTFAYAPDRVLIQRNLNPPNNGSLGALNVAGGAAPATGTVTFQNLMGDASGLTSLFMTERNTLAVMSLTAPVGSNASLTWYGVPAPPRIAGDLHIVDAIALEPTADPTLTQTRQVILVTDDVGNLTAELGPRLPAPTVSVAATTPYVRPRLDHTPAEPYHRSFVASFQQGSDATQRIATLQKSSGYIAAGGMTRLEVPDLSGATGWNNDWGLRTGAVTTWVHTATGWSGAGNLQQDVMVDGAILKSGTRMGQITP